MSKVGSESFSVDAAGPGTVEFAAPDATCPYMPDRWSAIGVEPHAVAALWMPAGDSVLMSARASPGPAGTFPEVIARPLDHARVAVDGQFALLPTLIDQSESAGERAEVRWQKSDAVFSAPYEYSFPTNLSYPSPGLRARLLAGESLAPTITILEDEFELPHVEAVPVDEIVELQLVPAYERSRKPEPEREWGRPAGVIAIALDGDGHRIVGAPVEWSVTRGDVSTEGSRDLGDDVLRIYECADPPPEPEWRSASVKAKLAGHVAVAELEWLALPSDYDVDPDNEWCFSEAEDDRSKSGCDCSATAASPAGAGWCLLAFAAIRRRRGEPVR